VPDVAFYFDVGSPYAYLTAERMGTLLPEPVTWVPVSLGGLFKAADRGSWALTDQRAEGIAEVQRRAAVYGLPPVRWPDPWPAHYLMAMRATTFAFSAGRGREFALQALRDAFVRGIDLSVAAHVLDVAQQVGLPRDATQAATEDPSIKLALRRRTEAAYALGVIGVPAISVDREVFWGDDRLEEAAARCGN
jgi:2-hydroxychromene-2-carboxylate isomerase